MQQHRCIKALCPLFTGMIAFCFSLPIVAGNVVRQHNNFSAGHLFVCLTKLRSQRKQCNTFDVIEFPKKVS